MTSSSSPREFSPDQQRYIDTTGDGDVDTIVLSGEIPQEGDTDSVGTDGEDTGISRLLTPLEMEEGVVNFERTPAPKEPNEQQVKAFSQLLQDNPSGVWQGPIDEIKNLYRETFKDV